MEIGKIRIDGIDVLSVEKMHFDAAINQHAKLELVCLIDGKRIQDYILLAQRQCSCEVKAEGKRLFCGIVTNVVCKNKKDNTKLYLTLMSKSYLLDIEKKSKSYQDINLTYQEIAQDKSFVSYGGDNPMINDIIIQYQETDWEFLKRISSRLSTGIFANVLQENGLIHWGLPDYVKVKEAEILNYDMEKDLQYFKECTQNEKKDVTLTDIITFEFESSEVFYVGDVIEVESQKIYITQVQWEMEQATLKGRYKGKTKKGFYVAKKYLYDMPGTALEGTVIDVLEDKVKIHLLIDEKQDKEKAYWFPFSAMEASADGSGWYYMPEIGDCVKVCIPAWEEQGAFAVSAVNTYENASEEKDMMSDTSVKYMRNPTGKQLQLTPAQIQADGGGGASIFSMDVQGNINLTGNQMVSLQATEIIELMAEEGIDIEASETINVKADMLGEILMNNVGELQHLGGRVNINSEE